jgi:hypothetical protein
MMMRMVLLGLMLIAIKGVVHAGPLSETVARLELTELSATFDPA